MSDAILSAVTLAIRFIPKQKSNVEAGVLSSDAECDH